MYQTMRPIAGALAIATNYQSVVVSNSCQSQLQRVFAHHNIGGHFSGGVFGSPTTKYTHIERIGAEQVAAFVGDGKLDWEVARHFGIPFVFVPMHSTWADGAATCAGCPGSTVCPSWAAVGAKLTELTTTRTLPQ
jgi:phosphoglycolate phosphatase-like HAD superfamily hydrolase